jgi:hypothetical protein
VPFTRAHEESNAQATEEVHERVLEAPVTITQRELLAISPDIRAQIADATRQRRQQVAQAMMFDIADEVPDVTTDSSGYEDMALRFQEAREASKALWHWQELEAAACGAEDMERYVLSDILDSFSLADTS